MQRACHWNACLPRYFKEPRCSSVMWCVPSHAGVGKLKLCTQQQASQPSEVGSLTCRAQSSSWCSLVGPAQKTQTQVRIKMPVGSSFLSCIKGCSLASHELHWKAIPAQYPAFPAGVCKGYPCKRVAPKTQEHARMHESPIQGVQEPDLAHHFSYMGELIETDALSAGEVACMPASVTLQKTPGGCNLKYTSSDVIQVSNSCKPLLNVQILFAVLLRRPCAARVQVSCSRVWISACCLQDRYCAMSITYGNSTTGTFKHPAEIFNFQKLLSVPNPFNIDLSLYTATAAASASPIKPPSNAHL